MSTPHGTGAPPPPSPPPPPPPAAGGGPRVGADEIRDLGRLRRSRHDRKIAGVAGGLARHLDVDPLLVRVGFVVLALFGGGGLLLYGAVWLLAPEDDSGAAIVRTDEGLRTAVIAIASGVAALALVGDSFGGPSLPWPLIVVGLVVLLVVGGRRLGSDRDARAAMADEASTPVPDPRRRGPVLFPLALALGALAIGVVATVDLAGVSVAPATYPAAVLGICGVLLLVGAFYGRAGGIVGLGLLAAVAMAGASVVDDATLGQRTYGPTTAAEVRDAYSLGTGQLVLDLADVADPAALDGRTISVRQGIGQLRVIVPDDGLRVVLRADTRAGEIDGFSTTSDGPLRDSIGDVDEPTLTLDLRVEVGQIDVETRRAAR